MTAGTAANKISVERAELEDRRATGLVTVLSATSLISAQYSDGVFLIGVTDPLISSKLRSNLDTYEFLDWSRLSGTYLVFSVSRSVSGLEKTM